MAFTDLHEIAEMFEALSGAVTPRAVRALGLRQIQGRAALDAAYRQAHLAECRARCRDRNRQARQDPAYVAREREKDRERKGCKPRVALPDTPKRAKNRETKRLSRARISAGERLTQEERNARVSAGNRKYWEERRSRLRSKG